jgi:hypothetical protein
MGPAMRICLALAAVAALGALCGGLAVAFRHGPGSAGRLARAGPGPPTGCWPGQMAYEPDCAQDTAMPYSACTFSPNVAA